MRYLHYRYCNHYQLRIFLIFLCSIVDDSRCRVCSSFSVRVGRSFPLVRSPFSRVCDPSRRGGWLIGWGVIVLVSFHIVFWCFRLRLDRICLIWCFGLQAWRFWGCFIRVSRCILWREGCHCLSWGKKRVSLTLIRNWDVGLSECLISCTISSLL